MVAWKVIRPIKKLPNLQIHRKLTIIPIVLCVGLSGCDYLLEPIEEGPPSLPTPVETTTPEPDVTETPTVTASPEPTPDEVNPEIPSDGDTSSSEEIVPEPLPSSTPIPEPTPVPQIEAVFEYFPPGDLEPNSGYGAVDPTIYVPDMVFPIKSAPAYPQSQVYRFGGGIGGGDQCDERNFEIAWRDNFCENRTRSTTSPYCPSQGVHVGQDIRVGTPQGCMAERRLLPEERLRYEVIAAEDGYISNIGRYTVNVRAGGRIYRYMHMNMAALQVTLGQEVKAGDVLGYVSNDFGGTPTTLHLHFEIKHNTAEHGWTWAPPYTSLVKAYERREQAPGEMVEAN
ncbi:M23 family metallopeptidase [Hirschia maritima]|uniref:M23 family metallopeptidase n=1 Tax=Hirschia maritima TaxID=1121961 RepID=UPI000362C13C|nr:M23 family metallopeptidase [Hirschia maritima]